MRGFITPLAILSSYALLSGAASFPLAKPDHDGLIQCLTSVHLDSVLTSSTSYAQDAAAFNARLKWKPAAIVYPQDANGVAAAVKCGAAHNVKVNARGGGHSYAAHGLGGEDGHLVVSLDNLRHLSMDGTNAIIGAGNRLGDVALYLWNNGKRAMAHGTCPFVGIGGHAGQGGFGPASRFFGLLADQVVGMDIVLANGTLVTASATAHADLFWAARGAGASFGIITSFTTVTQPAPDSYAFEYTFPNFSAAEASKGLRAWQQFSSDKTRPVDARLGLELHVVPGGKHGAVFSIKGAFYNADAAQANATMAPLLKELGSDYTLVSTQQNWIESVLAVAGTAAQTIDELNTQGRKDTPDFFFATSTFVSQNDQLGARSADALMNYLYNRGGSSKVQWFVFMDLYGGGASAVTSRAADFNAFDARDALYSIQYYGTIPDTVKPADGVKFIQGMKDAVELNQPRTTFKEYVNYIDTTYSRGVAHKKYYPTHTGRLTQLKQMYDPKRVIHHPNDF
ncbi:FAD-binding domain-containing protein [Daedaleopsis nitida]|nr:FAD-binding domain-containing protein [Daedaleopsis nitida]